MLQEELQEAAGDQGYRLLLWTWALLHCTLVAACCNFIGSNDVFPLAILGALLLASCCIANAAGCSAVESIQELLHGAGNVSIMGLCCSKAGCGTEGSDGCCGCVSLSASCLAVYQGLPSLCRPHWESGCLGRGRLCSFP